MSHPGDDVSSQVQYAFHHVCVWKTLDPDKHVDLLFYALIPFDDFPYRNCDSPLSLVHDNGLCVYASFCASCGQTY